MFGLPMVDNMLVRVDSYCNTDGTYRRPYSVQPVTPAPQVPAGPTQAEIDGARDQLLAQAETIVTVPTHRAYTAPTTTALVDVATWLWIDRPGARDGSAEAGPVRLDLHVAPRRVVHFDMGNGDQVSCSWADAGTAYDPGRALDSQHTNCSYTYERPSSDQPGGAHTVRATVVWDRSWTCSVIEGPDIGSCGADSLAPVTRSATTSLRVAEVQALVSG